MKWKNKNNPSNLSSINIFYIAILYVLFYSFILNTVFNDGVLVHASFLTSLWRYRNPLKFSCQSNKYKICICFLFPCIGLHIDKPLINENIEYEFVSVLILKAFYRIFIIHLRICKWKNELNSAKPVESIMILNFSFFDILVDCKNELALSDLC